LSRVQSHQDHSRRKKEVKKQGTRDKEQEMLNSDMEDERSVATKV
jgi:hypothetical protein